ncbi:MAG: glycogen/starch/alpha-glucan phosphorylase [Desulfovibrionaceae bacterium]
MTRKTIKKCSIVREDIETMDVTDSILQHIVTTLGYDCERASLDNIYKGLAYTVRDHLIQTWIRTQQQYYANKAKRVYYLSLEFLPGPFLVNNVLSSGMEEKVRDALRDDFDAELEDVAEKEWEPGLGNGGLGRLASCYLDSMAALKIPGYGYGIRYAYGIFRQILEDGRQIEKADYWLRFGNLWEFQRQLNLYRVRFGGSVRVWTDDQGRERYSWVHSENVKAMACDILVPGYQNDYVTNMRLWMAKSSSGFDLDYFNRGDYVAAIKDKIESETISMVLYPSDESDEGKELRFRQQYFLVSATLQDIMRRHRKSSASLDQMPQEVVIQLNETHPAIAIPEFMRLLLDIELLEWDRAWAITTKVFAYTNHTVLPEALEKWPVDLVDKLLPRHLMIIYEINRRFLEEVAERCPGDENRLRRMSIIEEGPERYVRMSHLAIVGSFSVNGVAALHTEIITGSIFRDFVEMWPGKFNNKTNGVTPRRFLLQANPGLSELITSKVGDGWIRDLDQLRGLEPWAQDPAFRESWMSLRHRNKQRLAERLQGALGAPIPPDSMFDVQVKRIHEYKRQLLNVLHVITRYNRIKDDPKGDHVPRTVLISGKAAPSYRTAKTIIKLINDVASVVNTDPEMGRMLRLFFLPNYSVSLNEWLLTATDLSEQISTSGMEASGTGNMKFALNGALTIGTLDGANVEIREEVGEENFFLFGLTAEEVASRRAGGYDPRLVFESEPELKRALDMIANGYFNPKEPELYHDLTHSLLETDWFMVLADYAAYIRSQDEVDALYRDPHEWTRRSILNTARMGKFSSDRSIMEYARDIWRTKPLP